MLNVLIADDIEPLRKIIKNHLEGIAICDEAENGEMAVYKFHRKKYDLVFLDVQMPCMDGFTALKWIRYAEDDLDIEEHDRVKVIVNSANTLAQNLEYESKAKGARYDAYIEKHFDEKQLKRLLAELGFETQSENV